MPIPIRITEEKFNLGEFKGISKQNKSLPADKVDDSLKVNWPNQMRNSTKKILIEK